MGRVSSEDEKGLSFESVITKQELENWSDDKPFDAVERLGAHLIDLFGQGRYTIVSLVDHGEHLILGVVSEKWSGTKEFGFDVEGKLFS